MKACLERRPTPGASRKAHRLSGRTRRPGTPPTMVHPTTLALTVCLIAATPVGAAEPAKEKPTAGPPLVLVDRGKPTAEIVIPEKRPRMVSLAALELQHFLQKMSGARLPIVTAPTPGKHIRIHIGRGAKTYRLGVLPEGLRDGAYRIATGPDWLVLIGRDVDFDHSKLPWPLSRKDVPRATAEWDRATKGVADAGGASPSRPVSRATGTRTTSATLK